MISKDDLKKLAQLSRLRLDAKEEEALIRDFESIIGYISDIQEVVVDEPTPEGGVLRNVMREDGEPHKRSQYTDVLTKAFQKRENNYLKVKKILNQK